MSSANVRNHYGVNELTVFFIKKNEATISRSVKVNVQTREQKYNFLIHRDPYLEKVQRTSYAWMENEYGNSRSIIRREYV
jgi:hypothetical protein